MGYDFVIVFHLDYDNYNNHLLYVVDLLRQIENFQQLMTFQLVESFKSHHV